LKCILFLLSDHVEIFYEDGEYVLEIYDTEISDKGLYKCVAKNEVGSAETQCILTLRGKSSHLLSMFNRLSLWSLSHYAELSLAHNKYLGISRFDIS